jgi:hypothetical protein
LSFIFDHLAGEEAAEDGAIAAAAGKISARQRENALDRVGQP